MRVVNDVAALTLYKSHAYSVADSWFVFVNDPVGADAEVVRDVGRQRGTLAYPLRVTRRHTESGPDQAPVASVRPAEPDDVAAILRLVHELAAYEKEPHAVEATEADFREALFPQEHLPTTFAHVADLDGKVVGMAIWYVTFSTWLGSSGIWLEDLFVSQEQRGSGLGKAMLSRLAAVCAERGYGRLEWWVLRWNTPSIGFYDSLGGRPMGEWLTYRLDGAALEALSALSPSQTRLSR